MLLGWKEVDVRLRLIAPVSFMIAAIAGAFVLTRMDSTADAWLVLATGLALGAVTVALGGRGAEELVFGQPSTGAESDLQQLTEIARQMVGRWGMSDRIGPVTVLPRPASGPMPAGVSDASQHALDDEVRRIVEQSHTDALTLLRENRDRLDALANALLEHETLGEEDSYAAAGLPEPGSAPGEFAAAAFTASPSAT